MDIEYFCSRIWLTPQYSFPLFNIVTSCPWFKKHSTIPLPMNSEPNWNDYNLHVCYFWNAVDFSSYLPRQDTVSLLKNIHEILDRVLLLPCLNSRLISDIFQQRTISLSFQMLLTSYWKIIVTLFIGCEIVHILIDFFFRVSFLVQNAKKTIFFFWFLNSIVLSLNVNRYRFI